MKKAIVIGTSTGIGLALVEALHAAGWEVGATGRYSESLQEIQHRLGSRIHIRVMDLRSPEKAMEVLRELMDVMGGVDLVIVNAGILPKNPKLDWGPEIEGVRVNVIGFQAMCHIVCHYFENQGFGHLVGISSIAAHRGTARSPTYNASKAFMAVYMEGLRQRYYQTKIHITDIRPGFIDTPMTADVKHKIGSVSAKQGAQDILQAISKKKKIAYVPTRWWWVAQVLKVLPEWIYHPIYKRYAS